VVICKHLRDHTASRLKIFRYSRVAVDSLTGIHNAMVKCLFIVSSMCIHKCLKMSNVKIKRVEVRRTWRPCSGSASTYRCCREHLAQHGWYVPEHHHAYTTFLLWLPAVLLAVALADRVRRNLGSVWGKTCGPTKQSPTIPAHTLTLKCCWCLHSDFSAVTGKLNVSEHMLM
jgi:hypothetical protein